MRTGLDRSVNSLNFFLLIYNDKSFYRIYHVVSLLLNKAVLPSAINKSSVLQAGVSSFSV